MSDMHWFSDAVYHTSANSATAGDFTMESIPEPTLQPYQMRWLDMEPRRSDALRFRYDAPVIYPSPFSYIAITDVGPSTPWLTRRNWLRARRERKRAMRYIALRRRGKTMTPRATLKYAQRAHRLATIFQDDRMIQEARELAHEARKAMRR